MFDFFTGLRVDFDDISYFTTVARAQRKVMDYVKAPAPQEAEQALVNAGVATQRCRQYVDDAEDLVRTLQVVSGVQWRHRGTPGMLDGDVDEPTDLALSPEERKPEKEKNKDMQ